MSTFKPRSELQRKTASTHNTAKNLRHLIATLRTRKMEMDAVSYLLACAPSTSRKYLNQLLDAKCIVVDHLLPKQERAHAGRIGVHPFKARFEARYGTQEELMLYSAALLEAGGAIERKK